MFRVYDFEPEHICPLIVQPMNKELADWYENGTAEKLKKKTKAFTGAIGDEIMICFGAMPLWKKRGALWTILSQNIRKHSVAVYRGLRQAIEEQPWFDRIEMDVPIDLKIAHKRARFMGFELECARARKFSPEGEDRALYAWVRS